MITKGETAMDQELFKKYFIFQMSTAMLKAYIIQIVKRKKNHLINVIKSGLSYLKDEIKEMSKGEIKLKNHLKQWILLKRFLSLIGKPRRTKTKNTNTRSNA